MSVVIKTATVRVNEVQEPPNQRTFIVLGAPRGGTSMTAGLLRIADVYMGENLDEDNNEDAGFLTHKGDRMLLQDRENSKPIISEYRDLVKKRNESHDVWGWKDPLSIFYLERIIDLIRNPFLVVVTRDITATTLRERAEFSGEISPNDTVAKFTLRKMQFANDLYARILNFVHTNDFPTLFISYERSLRYKENLTESILEFAASDNDIVNFNERVKKGREYVGADRVTGNLTATKSTIDKVDMLSAEIKRKVLSLGSLSEVYNAAAKLTNSAKYEEAKQILGLFDHVNSHGFTELDGFPINEFEFYDLYCASRFIKAIALVNLGEAKNALNEIYIYFGSMNEADKSGADLKISNPLRRPAQDLLDRLVKS